MGLSESTDFWEDPILRSDSITNEPPSTDNPSTNDLSVPSYQERMNKTQRANLRNKTNPKYNAADNDNNDDDDEEEEPQIELDEDQLHEEKMWIDAIAQDPKSSHLRNQLANHYFSRNRLNEAEFAYKAAITLDPKNAVAHYDFAFMRHHQFYWALGQFRMKDCTRFAAEAKEHYHHVLKLEENDVETHYQLSLLYLTMMETTLIQSIDHIRSPLATLSIQAMEPDICCGRRPLPESHSNDNETTNGDYPNSNNNDNGSFNAITTVNYSEWPIGRGVYSPWYSERIEIHDLCARHLALTMDSWGEELDPDHTQNNNDDDDSNGIDKYNDLNIASELDPVVFGSYITSARLLYLECIPPFCMNSERTQSAESQHNKLSLGIDRLQRALDRGGNDATLHHDLGLLLSHSVIGRYEEAISHWKMAVRMDAMNPVYDAQIGYLYQYQIGDVVAAMRHYEASLRLKGNQSQIWNNLGILWAQSASDGQHIAEATECWRRALRISAHHVEAHRNLGNIEWLHYRAVHRGEVHLQRAIAITSSVLQRIDQRLEKEIASRSQSHSHSRSDAVGITGSESNYLERMWMETASRQNVTYYGALRVKFLKFGALSKSDYGGLLLMMFRYDLEAERELEGALEYDAECVSAHYYLGKHLFETVGDGVRAKHHLERYINLEQNRSKNVSNRAHAQQILGDLALNAKRYHEAQRHFLSAIKLSVDKGSGESLLPKWAQCQLHCGFARSIVLYESSKLYDAYGQLVAVKARNVLHQLRSNQWRESQNKEDSAKHDMECDKERTLSSSDRAHLERLARNLEIAKRHYRRILKLDDQFVAAPLGLATILGKFEGKSLLSDKHYGEAIRLCRLKLIELETKYKEDEDTVTATVTETADGEREESKLNNNGMATSDSAMSAEAENEKERNSQKSFSKRFKVKMSEIEGILKEFKADKMSHDRTVIRTVKEMKQFMELLIEAHLGKIELIVQNCHHNKLKHALKHCHRILNLDATHIVALCKKAMLEWKMGAKKEATESAVHALSSAVEYDADYMAEIEKRGEETQKGKATNQQTQEHHKEITKENYVRHQLELLFNDTDNVKARDSPH